MESATTTRFPVRRVDRFFLLFEGHGPPATAMWGFVLDGPGLQRERFVRAVEHAMLRHPKAASRLVRERRGLRTLLAWEPVGDAAERACVFHEPEPALSEPDARARRFTELMNEPFDITTGPGTRFHWVPDGRRRGLLTFRFHHAVGDGHGSLIFLEDLLRFYNGEAPEDPSPAAPGRPAPLVEGSALRRAGLFWRLLAFQTRRGWSRGFAVPDTIFDTARSPGNELAATWRLLPPSRVKQLGAAAREAGMTLNDLILAAYGAAALRWKAERGLRPGTLRIMVNQSLRRPGHPRLFENRSSAFPVWIGADEIEDPRALARAVHVQVRECLRRRIAEGISLLGVFLRLPEGIARRLLTSTLTRPGLSDSLIVSNIGRLPTPGAAKNGWLRFGEAQLVAVHPYGRPSEGIGAIAFPMISDRGLILSLAYFNGLYSSDEVERYLTLVELALELPTS